jgi:hypothetical protein
MYISPRSFGYTNTKILKVGEDFLSVYRGLVAGTAESSGTDQPANLSQQSTKKPVNGLPDLRVFGTGIAFNSGSSLEVRAPPKTTVTAPGPETFVERVSVGEKETEKSLKHNPLHESRWAPKHLQTAPVRTTTVNNKAREPAHSALTKVEAKVAEPADTATAKKIYSRSTLINIGLGKGNPRLIDQMIESLATCADREDDSARVERVAANQVVVEDVDEVWDF